MINLGMTNAQKIEAIRQYRIDCGGIRKVFVLSHANYFLPEIEDSETIEYQQIIQYKYFYRLMQEIGNDTLVVVNECLRTQNRYDLTYNCIRNFLNQTRHQIIFQNFPIIDSLADFLILVDFDTQSRYKRTSDPDIIRHADVRIIRKDISLQPVNVPVSPEVSKKYQEEKKKLFDNIGLKDPHTLPRNLYLISGKAKLKHILPDTWYIGRNNRFKIEKLQTFKEKSYPNAYTVFEFCHNFIDFTDYLSLSDQREIPVMVADLKVDRWYFQRYSDWIGRLADAYSKIQLQKRS